MREYEGEGVDKGERNAGEGETRLSFIAESDDISSGKNDDVSYGKSDDFSHGKSDDVSRGKSEHVRDGRIGDGSNSRNA